MLNKIILMGRLTRDPELRQTQSGTKVASFSLAVDRDFVVLACKRETDFIDCVAWRGTGESAAEYFTKGQMAAEAAAEREWISVEDRLPGEAEEDVLAIVSGSPKRNLTLQDVAVIAVYCGEDGWYVNEYPEWEDPTVTYWMPLPEPPEEGNHGPTNI